MTIQKIEAHSPEARSADLTADTIVKLKALFPELITEGPNGAAVNVDVLKTLVGDQTATDADEKYGLNWHGKRRARQLALTPSTGTLRPCPEESVEWDMTKNLIIEGDNLEVLKLLQKSYAGKVKLIYIDPPYNTGSDFVYPDNFQNNIQNYLELTGQVEGGRKISSNTDASGRFHTDWLNMMYPRLKMARNLLTEDGVIFVSIDDCEANNLRVALDEVFGPENFIAQFVWEKRTTRENRRVFSFNHEYVICIAKNKELFEQSRNLLPNTEEVEARYSNQDNDARGPWQSVSLNAQAGHATKDQFYSYVTPGGRVLDPPPGRCWVVTKLKLDELVADNRVWFGEAGNNVPRRKLFRSEARAGLTPHTLWTASEVGTNDSAKKALIELFDGQDVFDTPKPVALIRRIVEIATDRSDLVVDFFAGAGTTMDAVLAQNAQDGGQRRCILVQLPEPFSCAEAADWTSIADVTRARVRGSGQRLKDADPMFAGDVGFRAFRLDTSNIRAWDPEPANLEQSLFAHQDHLLDGRTESDVLYELLLKLGIDLCVGIEHRSVLGKEVHAVGGGVLMACLATAIAATEVEAVALGIVNWHKELAPAGDTTCVFRDSAFADDVAKTNMASILEQNGIQNVRSL